MKSLDGHQTLFFVRGTRLMVHECSSVALYMLHRHNITLHMDVKVGRSGYF